ncbi:hypothetical protein BD770DRAFT_447111 [Pilaira anomala]|nr:hypothetical protein BD770DRAFT_447111 [Pilaira anomala]
MKEPIVKYYTHRLSSGSACEACRKRKTKCDGGEPCTYCASTGIQCSHRAITKLKKPKLFTVLDLELNNYRTYQKYSQEGSSVTSSYPADDPFNKSIKLCNKRIPTITDQLSCYTFTVEAAYAL